MKVLLKFITAQVSKLSQGPYVGNSEVFAIETITTLKTAYF